MTGIVAGEKGKQLRFMAPLMVEEPCLQCHAKLGYKLGDIRGGISVSQRYEPIEQATHVSIRQSMMAFGGIFLVVAVAGWGLLELLRRRWHDLAGKIRELEETRGELVQSEKMASLGRMVAGFAHEINTPVGVAVGAVSHNAETLGRIDKMLANEEVDEHELKAELDDLRHGGTLALSNLRRAANLVQSFKRTSIDQASEQVRDFAVKELIDDVLFSLHSLLKRLPVTIEVSCPDDLHLAGVPGLLNQVLTNLVINAVQHAYDGVARQGKMVIDAVLEGGHVRIVFADDGIGMSADQLARIFEPFYTTKRGNGGSGLGLYLCYEIVTARLGGTIRCESQPGAGCRFVIHFPVQVAEHRDALS
jgi:signal transduction histidine kinase